jgi:replicative DNA helicase
MTTMSNTQLSNLPYDEEMEKAVLGAVLLQPEIYLILAAIVEADDFFLLRHQYIWQACANIEAEGNTISRALIRRQLQDHNAWESVGGDLYLSELLTSTPSAGYAEQYARLVKRDSVRRQLLEAGGQIQQVAADKTKSMEDQIAAAEQLVLNVAAKTEVAQNYVTASESATAVLKQMEAAAQDKTSIGLPTGFDALDNLLGGLQRSDLVIFAGRPGMGKTSWALSVLRNACLLKGRVLYFSLEMGHEQLTQRLVSMETGVSMKALRTGQMTDKETSQSIEALGRISEWPYFVDDSATLNPLQARTKAQRVAYQYGLDLIVVDYLQLMNAPGYAGNRVQEISNVARSLKELARELHVPVLANAQLSRAVEQRQDKRPKLSDLRESGEIENAADIVMFLYRDVVYNEATENPNQADVIIAKHRNGPTDTVPLYFDASSTRFRDGAMQHIDLSAL